jgi:hypothetical protein
MAAPDPLPPPASRSHSRSHAFGLRRFAAIAVSIALHLAVLYALGALSWTTPEPETEGRISVVWLHDWRPPDHPHEAPPPEVEPQAPVARARLPEPPPPVPEAEPTPEDSPAEPVPAEPSPTVPAPERPATRVDPVVTEEAPDAGTEGSAGGPSISAGELAEVRRDVIESFRKDTLREDSYRTFSPDDLLADRPPAQPPPPERVARPWPPCPIVERRSVQFAMIMAGVCFRTRAPTDLLSRLRLDYRQGHPMCDRVIDGDGNETFKCHLVRESER